MKKRPSSTSRTSVLFIHGLWLHASSWQPWVDYFAAKGYAAQAPGWPDFPDSIDEARRHPEFMVEQTIGEVTDHYAYLIERLPVKPAVVGHSFGGLIAQELLDRDLVSAAVAIDPAPIKGVIPVPFVQLRASLPVLRSPFTAYRAVNLKPKQFRYGFANALSEDEAAKLYYEYAIPAPGKPLWQAALANLNPHAESRVDVRKDRAPLLLMAGDVDHTVPPQTTRIVRELYRESPAVTDLKEWPDRGHSLTIDKGWREVADYTLQWLEAQDVRPGRQTQRRTASPPFARRVASRAAARRAAARSASRRSRTARA